MMLEAVFVAKLLVPPSQFQDPDFGGLSGGRVVRIAVHPDYQGVTCPCAFKPGAIISCRRVAGHSVGQVYLVVYIGSWSRSSRPSAVGGLPGAGWAGGMVVYGCSSLCEDRGLGNQILLS